MAKQDVLALFRRDCRQDRLSEKAIRQQLEGHPWQDRVTVLDSVDSTNSFAKQLAADGAPEGTAVLARLQTGGRGRLGRSFSSPSDQGIYLSVILRPQAKPTELLHLTAAAAEAAAEASLKGLEFSFGIPGRLGGALTMNAGAYGGEMVQVVRSVRIMEKDGTIRDVPAHDLAFGYRTSRIAEGRIALSCVMELKKGVEAEIREKMATYQQARKDKQPLQYPSAGSVFKRPVGYFAGALIEQANLKGASVGGAQVSEKHAGFIINKGGATCQDVLELIDFVQRKVYETSGVKLETELRPVGDLG